MTPNAAPADALAKADHPERTGAERLLAVFRQQETHAALRILTSREGASSPAPFARWRSSFARSRSLLLE